MHENDYPLTATVIHAIGCTFAAARRPISAIHANLFEEDSAVVVDFHTHLFPRFVRENRERWFADEPAFELLYAHPKARLASAGDIIAAMDAQQVDLAVVFGFPWRCLETAKRHNDYIMEAVNRYPDRLMGFCCLDPCAEKAPREVARCFEGGLCGVGELAFYECGIACTIRDNMAPVMALCREHDKPVLIHTNEPVGHRYAGKTDNTLIQIYELAKAYPLNHIVLAHWGGGLFFYQLLKKEVGSVLANVYFDTAASPFLYKPSIYRYAVELAGCEKILFGSDYPLINPRRYFAELEISGLHQDQIDAIKGGNALKLLARE